MSRKIAILTDGTCDLPAEVLAEREIHLIPQRVMWDNQLYRTGIDLTIEDFYQRLATSATLPESAPPSAEDFAVAFEDARARQKADQVVAIILSSRLSESFVNAQQGARLVDFPVFVMDTLTISTGLAFAVLAADSARKSGASVEQILDAARETRRATHIYFTLGTLDFLHRGGRVSNLRHMIGTALNLKPILTVANGQVEAAENQRSHPRAVQRMIELARNGWNKGAGLRVAVGYGDNRDEAEVLSRMIWQEWRPHEMFVVPVSPAVGAHTGPNILSIASTPCT